MAILTMREDGTWQLAWGSDLEPHCFWPYTSLVRDVVVSGPIRKFEGLHHELLVLFQDNGIKAYADNKSVFVLKDDDGRLWYFGFKDLRFDLGLGVKTDDGLKPVFKTV